MKTSGWQLRLAASQVEPVFGGQMIKKSGRSRLAPGASQVSCATCDPTRALPSMLYRLSFRDVPRHCLVPIQPSLNYMQLLTPPVPLAPGEQPTSTTVDRT